MTILGALGNILAIVLATWVGGRAAGLRGTLAHLVVGVVLFVGVGMTFFVVLIVLGEQIRQILVESSASILSARA
jgi:hypothetical protein